MRKRLLVFPAAVFIAGCLAAPVGRSGGLGSVTVSNSNPGAVIAALQAVFSRYGYQMGPVNYPDSASFDKPSSAFANVMWGSYGDPQTLRVSVSIMPIAGTSDLRLVPRVSSVSDAGEAGFESARPLSRLWSAEFGPILEDAASQASGAGEL